MATRRAVDLEDDEVADEVEEAALLEDAAAPASRSSGVPFSAIAEPSTVRHGMNRSQGAVSVPWRASMPSLATSSSLQVNRLGICCL